MERANGILPAVEPIDHPRESPDSPVDRLDVVLAYLRLPHPEPIAVVLAATLGFALLFGGGSLGWLPVVGLLVAMFGGQLAIGALNELIDAELDALAKPWKPIPAGLVSRRGAWAVVAGGLALMVVCGALFGPAALFLLVLGTAIGLAYDLWCKRTPWSWLPYVVAVPLLPIWVRTALIGFDARLLLLFPMGVGAVAGIHLAQALPDCAGDRAAGLRNPVSMLGETRSLAAACILVATAPAAALVAGVVAPGAHADGRGVAGAAAISAGLVVGLAVLYRRRPAVGVRVAFPCLAVATLVVALGWVVAAG